MEIETRCSGASILLVLAAWSALAQTPQTVPPGAPEPPAAWGKPKSTPNDSLVSPEVSPDGRVTFRLYAPEANSVTVRVNSDFFTGPLPFTKDTQGVWSATTKPVSSGAYRYNFIVDGAIVLDNRNPSTSPGALNVQSLVQVPVGPDDIQANKPGIAHGTLSTVSYDLPFRAASPDCIFTISQL